MGLAVQHCNNCNRHWKQADYDSQMKRSKSKSQDAKKRSKSRERKPKGAQAQAQERGPTSDQNSLQVFVSKTPWINTTPRTKVDAEVGLKDDDLPPQPNLPPPPGPPQLTPQQEQYKQQLVMLKAMRGSLPVDLEKELQELSTEQQLPVLTHKHINQLTKMEKAVSTLQKKLAEMDAQWQAFVEEANAKFSKHKEMFLDARGHLLKSLQEKVSELNVLKSEISKASEGLAQPVEDPDQVHLSQSALTAAMSQVQFPQVELAPPPQFLWEAGELEEVDADRMEESPDEGNTGVSRKRPVVAPFTRNASSPSKVHNGVLKPSSAELKARKDTKQKEAERDKTKETQD